MPSYDLDLISSSYSFVGVALCCTTWRSSTKLRRKKNRTQDNYHYHWPLTTNLSCNTAIPAPVLKLGTRDDTICNALISKCIFHLQESMSCVYSFGLFRAVFPGILYQWIALRNPISPLAYRYNLSTVTYNAVLAARYNKIPVLCWGVSISRMLLYRQTEVHHRIWLIRFPTFHSPPFFCLKKLII